MPFVSQIDGNLWQGGCEDGLILPDFFRHVVSLYPWESYTIEHEISSVLQIAMLDSLDQEFDRLDAIAHWVRSCLEDGPTLVHCQAGLNRSSLVAARVLMLGGLDSAAAIAKVRASRSPACLCIGPFVHWLGRSTDPERWAAHGGCRPR